MEPLAIVVNLDVFEYVRFGLFPRRKALTVDGLDLQTVVPTLHGRIVVTVAFLAHAASKAVIAEQALVILRAVLAAAIGVNDITSK